MSAPEQDQAYYRFLTRRQALLALQQGIRTLLSVGLTGTMQFLLARNESSGMARPYDLDQQKDVMPTPSRATSEPDRYRLPRHIVPTRYELRIEPDLVTHTFVGQETIVLTVHEPSASIVLNAVDLDILSASLQGADSKTHPEIVELQEDKERCRIRLASPIAPGTWSLHLHFQGKLNDKLRGFYRSTYIDDSGVTHVLAATQFEATDARRAFPCWDEPDLKATFALSLVVDPHLIALSNTKVVEDRLENGKKVVRFAETLKMPTYLVTFVVGRLEPTEAVFVGNTPIRIWAVPGKGHLTPFGLDIAAFSLQFFSTYYGIPYPGDKLDLIALPDFAAGAMENLGAITFRETALLVDRQTAALDELQRIADVVAHENAHMWFGDLVTMSWWNGLWLNEAFATFMEMLAVDAWKPEWERLTSFAVTRSAALSVDGLHSTRPIEYPVRAPKDAEAMFDVLTYEKGAAVLRMLEQDMGPSVFRDGVRDYLRTHAYGNADTKDLWVSLGRAAKRDIPGLMNEWIFSPGYPAITATLQGETTLVLKQHRFTYLSHWNTGAHEQPPTEQRWQIPVRLEVTGLAQSKRNGLLLTDVETKVPLPRDWQSVLVNAGGQGFYRVHYAPELLARLEQAGIQRLAPIDRFNLINDAWAGTLAGIMSPADYLGLTARFTDDLNPNVWSVLLGSFTTLSQILTPNDRPALETFVRRRISPALNLLGWEVRSEDSDLLKDLRGDLVRALGTLGNDRETQLRAAELDATYQRNPERTDPNLLPALVSILAYIGDASRYQEFFKRFKTASTPQEERRYLFALAAFRSPDLIDQTLVRCLDGTIRTQDAPFVISAGLMNIAVRDRAWSFMKSNWETMDRQFPRPGLRRMCGGIVGLSTLELERDVHHFFQSRKIDLGGKLLEQYLEQLRVAVAFRERDTASIRKYLQTTAPLA